MALHEVEKLIEKYVRSMRTRTRAVSMHAAMRAVKAALPNIKKSDRDIEALIARQAMRHGFAIDFDRKHRDHKVSRSAVGKQPHDGD